MKNNSNFEDKIRMAKEISESLKSGQKTSKNPQGISEDKINKIKSILNDENAMKQIMNSDTAKELLKKFGKE